jgi:uncharacterized membrane protein
VQQLVLVLVGLKEISDEFVHKQINKTNVKKATGRDGISAKLLKLAKLVIAKPITKMNDNINMDSTIVESVNVRS